METYLDSFAQTLGLFDVVASQSAVRIVSASIIVTILFGFVLLFYKMLSQTISKGDTILILGTVDAGKTVLYFQLFTGKFCVTHTSMKENIGNPKTHQTAGKKLPPYRYIDFPGHKTQRPRLSSYYSQTRAIIFLVDICDIKSYKSAGEYLFSLMTDPILLKKKIPLLIAFNKIDIQEKDSQDTEDTNNEEVKKKLLEHLEKCRAGALAGISTLGSSDHISSVELGIRGQKFQFAHSPLPIQFANIAANSSQITPVLTFISKQ